MTVTLIIHNIHSQILVAGLNLAGSDSTSWLFDLVHSSEPLTVER